MRPCLSSIVVAAWHFLLDRCTLPKECADVPKNPPPTIAGAADEDEEGEERMSLVAAGKEPEDEGEACRLRAENEALKEQLELVRLREENEQLRAELEAKRPGARPRP